MVLPYMIVLNENRKHCQVSNGEEQPDGCETIRTDVRTKGFDCYHTSNILQTV